MYQFNRSLALIMLAVFLSSCISPGTVTINSAVPDATVVPLKASGLPVSRHEVRVVSIKQENTGDKSGIMIGDVIIAVNGKPVFDHNHAKSLLRDSTKGTIDIKRGTSQLTVNYTTGDITGLVLESDSLLAPAQITGEGQTIELLISHPEYHSFVYTAKPDYRINSLTPTLAAILAGGVMGFGLIFGGIGAFNYFLAKEVDKDMDGTGSSRPEALKAMHQGLSLGFMTLGTIAFITPPIALALVPVASWKGTRHIPERYFREIGNDESVNQAQ